MRTEQQTSDMKLGTITLSKDYFCNRHDIDLKKGEIVEICKVLQIKSGLRYYKLNNSKVWISDNEVCDVNIVHVPQRRTVVVYSA